MSKIIYIRHGKDERARHKYDEVLTEEGKIKSRELARKLLDLYGVPDIIYYSPYYRTRQTRKEMVKEIIRYKQEKGIDKRVEIVLEPRLGRFFTKRQSYDPDISRKTMKKGAIINERPEEFKDRVREQLEDRKNEDYNLIWNITHTLVLLRTAEFSQISRSSHVEYSDYLVIDS